MSKLFLQKEYISPFIRSINELFNTMLDLEVSDEKPFVDINETVFQIGIAANVGISGKIKGVISLLLTEEVALFLTSRFMDDNYEVFNDFVKSTIGELTNIIVGGAKRHFIEMDQDFKIAIPNIFIGKIKEVYTNETIPSIYIPFSVEQKTFYLKICLAPDLDSVDESKISSLSDNNLREKFGELIFTMFNRSNINNDKTLNISSIELFKHIELMLEKINNANIIETDQQTYLILGEVMNNLLSLYQKDPQTIDQFKLSTLLSIIKKIKANKKENS